MKPKFISGPPGTGKTNFFLKEKYEELVKQYGHEKIIILSHTNVAADEIREVILNLPLMKNEMDSKLETNFKISIEASAGVTIGISAYDRAHTIRTAVMPDANENDISRPGHIFPLMSQPGGVLTRAGHTEAGCDLARLAGFEPASVIV